MKKKIKYIGTVVLWATIWSCKVPTLVQKSEELKMPEAYAFSSRENVGKVEWKDFFSDKNLQKLIDSALVNNQELNITSQEIEIANNEIMARKGEYLPFVNLKAGLGLDKEARYTRKGAAEHQEEIRPGKEISENVGDFGVQAIATWELDVWHKLRNAKKAAVNKYLASVEGKSFLQTQLISEIASLYYELLALDSEYSIVNQYIEIQSNALNMVSLLKNSTRSNELAVMRFQAQLLKTEAMKYDIQQKIVEAENEINFLVGRYPKHIERSSDDFTSLVVKEMGAGIPLDLVANRPDVKKAEFELAANKLNVAVAKAKFYPQFGLSAGLGLKAYSPVYLIKPKSIFYDLAGDMLAPLINKRAITADYLNANAEQIQAIYNYQKTVLAAYNEVSNQLSNINNLENKFSLKEKEVEALNKSITISNSLFKNARADYMEVLLTQREALETKFELIETKMLQMKSTIGLYKALGGGVK